jgi:hypothetical protein
MPRVRPPEGEATLHRIVVRRPGSGFAFSFIADQITPDEIKPDKNLTAALFGDVSKLHMEFRNHTNPQNSYLLKGLVLAGGRQIVTLSRFDADAGGTEPWLTPTNGGQVRVGTLVNGDPWEVKFFRSKRLVETNGIKIYLDFQYSGKPGMYLSYRFTEVSLDDTNLAKPFHYQGKADSTGAIPDGHVVSVGTHHGLMDRFEFTFDHAKYVLGFGRLGITYKGQPEKVILLDNCADVYKCGVDLLKR